MGEDKTDNAAPEPLRPTELADHGSNQSVGRRQWIIRGSRHDETTYIGFNMTITVSVLQIDNHSVNQGHWSKEPMA